MPVDDLIVVSAISLRFFAVWLFVSSALSKLCDIPRFSATLGAYRLVPESLLYPAALAVIAFEILGSFALLPLQLLPEAASAMTYLVPTLLLVYAIAMAINLKRGRRSIDCGCGGAPMPLSRALVLRNVALAGMLLFVLTQTSTSALAGSLSSLNIWLLLLVTGCVLVLCFIYTIFNQLLANRAVHQRLWLQIS